MRSVILHRTGAIASGSWTSFVLAMQSDSLVGQDNSMPKVVDAGVDAGLK
jgi:hypothetical protein